MRLTQCGTLSRHDSKVASVDVPISPPAMLRPRIPWSSLDASDYPTTSDQSSGALEHVPDIGEVTVHL